MTTDDYTTEEVARLRDDLAGALRALALALRQLPNQALIVYMDDVINPPKGKIEKFDVPSENAYIIRYTDD